MAARAAVPNPAVVATVQHRTAVGHGRRVVAVQAVVVPSFRAAEDLSLAPPLRIARRHQSTPIAVGHRQSDASHAGPPASLSEPVEPSVHFFHWRNRWSQGRHSDTSSAGHPGDAGSVGELDPDRSSQAYSRGRQEAGRLVTDIR